jgi:predicted O-methyltransferase YrrM
MTKSELLVRVPPLYRLARAWRDRGHAREHPPTRVKHDVLRQTARAHGLRTLVETGTYMGETGWAMRREFDRIETIELQPTLAALARVRFARAPNVTVHEGDSGVVLQRILDGLDSPALFWLDAHPCTDRAASGTTVPLLAELAAIARHCVSGHAIVIDDMRLMGTPGFPRTEELALPAFRFEQIGDVGVLTPVAQPSLA